MQFFKKGIFRILFIDVLKTFRLKIFKFNKLQIYFQYCLTFSQRANSRKMTGTECLKPRIVRSPSVGENDQISLTFHCEKKTCGNNIKRI